MSHVAVIVGISGLERYLRQNEEVTEQAKAQRFRSPQSALEAARRHIQLQPPVVARHMGYRAEPV